MGEIPSSGLVKLVYPSFVAVQDIPTSINKFFLKSWTHYSQLTYVRIYCYFLTDVARVRLSQARLRGQSI